MPNAGAVITLLLTASMAVGCKREEPLPKLMPIQEFALTDQHGKRFGTEELKGKVWVANFFFARCTQVCPRLTSHVAQLHREATQFGDKVHFVSITVDPKHDRPSTLRSYAQRFGADLSRWTFLTGAPDRVNSVVEGHFPSSHRRQGQLGGRRLRYSAWQPVAPCRPAYAAARSLPQRRRRAPTDTSRHGSAAWRCAQHLGAGGRSRRCIGFESQSMPCCL